jgi:hypothetical protein
LSSAAALWCLGSPCACSTLARTGVIARCIAMRIWQDMWHAHSAPAETCYACLMTSMIAALPDASQPQKVVWQRLSPHETTTAIAMHSKETSIGRKVDIDVVSGHVQPPAVASPVALTTPIAAGALPSSTGPPAADAGALPTRANSPVQTPGIPSLWEIWLLDSVVPSWRKGFEGAVVYGSADSLAQVCSSSQAKTACCVHAFVQVVCNTHQCSMYVLWLHHKEAAVVML